MIPTRRRAKRFPWARLFTVIAVVAMLPLLLLIPPIHRVVFTDRTNAALQKAAAPLTVAGAMQRAADRDREIKRLQEKRESDRQSLAARDASITNLQQTVNQLQDELASSASKHDTPKARPSGTPGGFGPATVDDVHRTAQTWAAMDPERAAAIVGRVPESYAVKVLGAMPSDTAGEILAALPPGLAARLSTSEAPR